MNALPPFLKEVYSRKKERKKEWQKERKKKKGNKDTLPLGTIFVLLV